MVTKNRRVAAYLPPHVDERFQEFKQKADIKGDSEAFIKIIMEYLGVNHPVTQKVSFTQFSELIQRLEVLESKEFVEQRQLDELKADVTKDIALAISAQSKEKAKSSGEKVLENSKSDSSPLQLGLVGKAENEDSELPGRSPDGLNGVALSKYLGVDRSTLSGAKKKGKAYLLEWSARKDPYGRSWEYREDDKLYYIVIPV